MADAAGSKLAIGYVNPGLGTSRELSDNTLHWTKEILLLDSYCVRMVYGGRST
jgi:hypothetical protein